MSLKLGTHGHENRSLLYIQQRLYLKKFVVGRGVIVTIQY